MSVGSHGNGALLRGVQLPTTGPGYTFAPASRERAAFYGTAELALLVTRACAAVERAFPGSTTVLGDLSVRGGGATPVHGSHESGRDVDAFFFGRKADGTAYRPDRSLIHYTGNGRAWAWSPPHGEAPPREPVPPVRFDAARTWVFVRSVLTDPVAEVQWIFVQRDLGERLLEEARMAGEDEALVERAQAVFHQPSDGDPHDDHMHVRVYCDPGDRGYGCVDKGPQRWLKKHWKYLPPGDTGARESRLLTLRP